MSILFFSKAINSPLMVVQCIRKCTHLGNNANFELIVLHIQCFLREDLLVGLLMADDNSTILAAEFLKVGIQVIFFLNEQHI